MFTKRILIVDDEPGVTRNLKLNLEMDGEYFVQTENDSTNAVDAAKRFRPDLILLDVIMPGVDGGEVAASLKDEPDLHSTPVIFLTALVTNDETKGSETTEGGQYFLAKPVDVVELKRSINKHLRL